MYILVYFLKRCQSSLVRSDMVGFSPLGIGAHELQVRWLLFLMYKVQTTSAFICTCPLCCSLQHNNHHRSYFSSTYARSFAVIETASEHSVQPRLLQNSPRISCHHNGLCCLCEIFSSVLYTPICSAIVTFICEAHVYLLTAILH